jgi:hypothetical protein
MTTLVYQLNVEEHITPSEYLSAEKTSNIKHQYLDRQTVAMVGANLKHTLIVGVTLLVEAVYQQVDNDAMPAFLLQKEAETQQQENVEE